MNSVLPSTTKFLFVKEKAERKSPCRHGRFSIFAAPLIIAFLRELDRKNSGLRHTAEGKAMLASITEIDLPPCIGLFLSAFSIYALVPETTRAYQLFYHCVARANKQYITRSVERSDSEMNVSTYVDQNHAPSLTCVRFESCNG